MQCQVNSANCRMILVATRNGQNQNWPFWSSCDKAESSQIQFFLVFMPLEVVAKSDIAQHECYPRGYFECIGTIFVVGTLLIRKITEN